MTHRLKGIIIIGAAAAALGAGAAVASGTSENEAPGRDDDTTERPITGAALDRASDAAIARAGGGKVTGSEAGDEDGYYEIEITGPDGTQVDVHLDRAFNVLSVERDGS
jgi:hypothetical protein